MGCVLLLAATTSQPLADPGSLLHSNLTPGGCWYLLPGLLPATFRLARVGCIVTQTAKHMSSVGLKPLSWSALCGHPETTQEAGCLRLPAPGLAD